LASASAALGAPDRRQHSQAAGAATQAVSVTLVIGSNAAVERIELAHELSFLGRSSAPTFDPPIESGLRTLTLQLLLTPPLLRLFVVGHNYHRPLFPAALQDLAGDLGSTGASGLPAADGVCAVLGVICSRTMAFTAASGTAAAIAISTDGGIENPAV
jgi:hypothetical protein